MFATGSQGPKVRKKEGRMIDNGMPPRKNWLRRLLYAAAILVTAVITFGLVALLMNISERKREAQEHFLKVVDLDEDTIDPAVWGQNFPREYDGYKRTADNERSGAGEPLTGFLKPISRA